MNENELNSNCRYIDASQRGRGGASQAVGCAMQEEDAECGRGGEALYLYPEDLIGHMFIAYLFRLV